MEPHVNGGEEAHHPFLRNQDSVEQGIVMDDDVMEMFLNCAF